MKIFGNRILKILFAVAAAVLIHAPDATAQSTKVVVTGAKKAVKKVEAAVKKMTTAIVAPPPPENKFEYDEFVNMLATNRDNAQINIRQIRVNRRISAGDRQKAEIEYKKAKEFNNDFAEQVAVLIVNRQKTGFTKGWIDAEWSFVNFYNLLLEIDDANRRITRMKIIEPRAPRASAYWVSIANRLERQEMALNLKEKTLWR